MKNWVRLGILGLLLVLSYISEATEHTCSVPDRALVVQAVRDCTEQYGPLVVKTGEISATADGEITLGAVADGQEKTFSSSAAAVFINGQLGITAALRPIAPEFYFAARLYFDQQGVLRLVDGWYVGIEVEVLAVDTTRRALTVRPIDQGATWRLTLSPLLSLSNSALTPGDSCFLLLDWENNIRKVIGR